VFHELYATGLPWQRSFWVSLQQRRIASSLAAMSDGALTTSPAYGERLSRWQPDLQPVVSPVFSNVGESRSPLPLASRGPFAVVFGKDANRLRAYAALRKPGFTAGDGLRKLGVVRIWDIGPPAPVPRTLGGLPVERLGSLDAYLTSARLAQARVGLVEYPLHISTKSGILAAYFAHGLLVVNTCSAGMPPSGLKEGCHFLHPDRLSEAGLDHQAVANEGHTWYCAHGREATAEIIAALLS
jgi:hypothetical protein